LTTSSDQKFKADAGKLQARLLFEGMPRALKAIIAVLSYGAQKYEAHSWKGVSDERYRDAKFRHLMDMMSGPYQDDESGLPHSFHEATNTLFLLEKELSRMTEEEFEETLKFHKPPQDHKK
jgi:hypothetical protein